jgi:two-component system, OmpR family, response regulator VanR
VPILIVIIDLELPEESGTEFINCLHNKGVQSPIITTTTNTNEKKLFEAINLDITQYLMKPYTKNELYGALEVAINKVNNTYSLAYTSLNYGFSYDPVNKVINGSDGTVSHLSKKKYLFLELLLKSNKHIVPYHIIESRVWDDSVMTQNALRTLVRDIRKHSYNDIVSNYNGIGYRIDV